jgi:UDP-glucose 4-epimerase
MASAPYGAAVVRLLVTGGAGFVGSVTADLLLHKGHDVAVLDDLRTGFRENLPEGARFYEVDLEDGLELRRVFSAVQPEAVLHFAASCIIPESIQNPLAYWAQNFSRTQDLVGCMMRSACNALVFSSSVAVYGNPRALPMIEAHPPNPANPYGYTKMCAEAFLASMAPAGLRSVSLRFFNAVGCSSDGRKGQYSDPETRLIPRAIHAALGLAPPLTIFGDDWPTPDGTCVRDFICVQDLAAAHEHALDAFGEDVGAKVYNLGNGRGYSVLEVIKSVERVTGQSVPYAVGPRREGDVASMLASAVRAKRELGWSPEFTELDQMVESAWHWHRQGWAELHSKYGAGRDG